MVSLRRSSPGIAVLLALLAPALRANTYTVNASGGAQFTDIQSAIAAAQAGDVLLVAGGIYPGFVLDKGLVVLGQGAVHVAGTAGVANVPATQRAALVNLLPEDVSVTGCAGAVILEDLGTHRQVRVSQSNDVRATRIGINLVQSPLGEGISSLVADNARVEIVDSFLWADQGVVAGTSGPPWSAGVGGSAVVVGPATRAHVVRSTLRGGMGGHANTQPLHGGDGGPALSMSSPCEVFFAGPGGTVYGADGGFAWWYGYCDYDGDGACAIAGSGTVVHSGTQIEGGYTPPHPFDCFSFPYYQEPDFCGPSQVVASPADPSLRLTGNVIPGGLITFTLYGEPGATALLNLGRNPVLTQTAGVDIEILANPNRVLSFGTIPPSGQVSRNALLPASYTKGLLFVAQAQVVGSSGLKRTNSTPIIVR